jgi:hypothetical protein
MLIHPGGGFRTSPEGLIAGLLGAAFLQIFYLRLPSNEGTYVRAVLENFEELRRASRKEPVRANILVGFSGVTLPLNSQIATPWGIVRPAPVVDQHDGYIDLWRQQTSCILAEPKLLRVRFDRAPSPENDFDPLEVAAQRGQGLFPLACALASEETASPAVPLVTWSTTLLPFQQGFSFSQSSPAPRLRPVIDLGGRIKDIEIWARVIEEAHVSSVEVAARRLISASGQRVDRSDSLIDAVIVWESLVGTPSETSFRVTAALAKMLELDRGQRRSLRTALGKIYTIRSQVVHGVVVDPVSLDKAATEAVSIAVRALRAAYSRGHDWLSLTSTQRADTVLLEDP